MLRCVNTIFILLITLLSLPANAVYFPDGIDWTHPSSERFVMSLYLNTLGRAPQRSELRNQSARLAQSDSREQRLALFQQFITSGEYKRLFRNSDQRWRIYRAPDYNHNNGNGYWRYQASTTILQGFQQWQSDGPYTQSIASSLASYYSNYCYSGLPCIDNPELARSRDSATDTGFTQPAHACADENRQNSQFIWVANNGTTYPRGIDNRTLCMGQHYYEIVSLSLKRYQCEAGYVNCKRQANLDLKGERSGQDHNGNAAIFFGDGSRLALTDNLTISSSTTGNQPSQTESGITAGQHTGRQHACADPDRSTSQYRWRGPNATSISRGVDNSVICMDNYFYVIDGINLRRYDCSNNFYHCERQSTGDLNAKKRTRVNGDPGLLFNNGTTVVLVGSNNQHAQPGNSRKPVTVPRSPTVQSPTTGSNNAHACANPVRRVSQFRWLKKNGTSTWPDGVDGHIVCQNDSYYVIEGITLRHHQCARGFTNCRSNSRQDLIATRSIDNGNGYQTLIFANGDQLSLINK